MIALLLPPLLLLLLFQCALAQDTSTAAPIALTERPTRPPQTESAAVDKSSRSVVDASTTTVRLFTQQQPSAAPVDAAVVIGAAIGGLACLLLVGVAAGVFVYIKRKQRREIAAIASNAADPAFDSFHSFHQHHHSTGVTVANKSFLGAATMPTLGPSALAVSFNAGSAGGGAYKCPRCENYYPTAEDVTIHVQKRHVDHASVGYSAGDFVTAEFRPSDIKYDAGLPASEPEAIKYDTEMPMHSSVEPANRYGLPAYAQQSEERFARFQS